MYLETETLDNEGLRHFKTLGIEAIDNLVELFLKLIVMLMSHMESVALSFAAKI